MKRTITLEQRQGNHHVFGPKRTHRQDRDCTNCRHSETRIVGNVLRFFCKVTQQLTGDTCALYSDAREPHLLNWHTVR